MSDENQASATIDTAVHHANSGARIAARTALIMLAFTVIFTALMAGTHRLTEPMLAASAEQHKLRVIGEVLPATAYTNNLLNDFIIIPPLAELNTEVDTRLYRARKDGAPVALVFEAAANDGYSGRIELMLAVASSGRLLAQRVTAHKETPGLGDYIDPRKDRNKTRPWISQFNGQGFDTVPLERWRVRKDGGEFDQMAGATISARAVTNASRRALEWANRHCDRLFDMPTGQRLELSPAKESHP